MPEEKSLEERVAALENAIGDLKESRWAPLGACAATIVCLLINKLITERDADKIVALAEEMAQKLKEIDANPTLASIFDEPSKPRRKRRRSRTRLS